MVIDFKMIATELLSQSERLVREWLPDGKKNGNEYVCAGLGGGEGRSFSVNLATGQWADFAYDDVKGGDLISLYAAINGLSQSDAVRALGYTQEPMTNKKKNTSLRHPAHGEPVHVWKYHDRNGEVLGFVARYEDERGKKQYMPWRNTVNGVIAKSLEKPRPLYNLPGIHGNPDSRVLIVEGEKAADAAQKIVGDRYVVTTWPGGSKAAKYANLKPLHGRDEILIWPDSDEAGVKCAKTLTEMLGPHVKTIKVIDPSGMDEGFDAADADWDWKGFLEWARDRVMVVTSEEERIDVEELEGVRPEGLTDLGNAKRLVRARGELLRFVPEWNRWLIWEDTHWKSDSGVRINREFDHVLSDMDSELEYIEALSLNEKIAINTDRKDYTINLPKWREKCEARARIISAVDLAKSRPEVEVDLEELDSHEWLLNCANGTVDLRTGELMPHNPRHLLTQMCPTNYNPNAECPKFLRFLDDILVSPDLIEYIQKVFGYGLSGSVREDCIWIFWGSGANGKSTLSGILQSVIGKDYAGSLAPDLLMESRNEKHATGLADLYRRRAVWADETGEGRRIDEGLVKRLTGGDAIKARRMREDFWEFEPTHKLFLSTNHKPEVRGADRGIWRRLKLIPFIVTITPDRMDLELDEKLRGESEGILRWLVEGARKWLQDGLTDPQEVTEATQEYRDESDPVSEFIVACCERVPTGMAKASDLYQAFREWFDINYGQKPMSGTMFGRRMSDHFDKVRKKDGMRYLDVQLQPQWMPKENGNKSWMD